MMLKCHLSGASEEASMSSDMTCPPNRTVKLLRQMSISDSECSGKGKQNRREGFLFEMERAGLWKGYLR